MRKRKPTLDAINHDLEQAGKLLDGAAHKLRDLGQFRATLAEYSMGWLDYHLHLFRVTKPVTGEVLQIGIPDDDAIEGDEPVLPGWEIPIAHYFSHPGVIAQYDYDFGDGWEHELMLEAILPRQPGKQYPRCVTGARACPPEDCGGIGGYENLVTVIKTPAHEEYESTLQWLGGRFDPEAFNPAKATKAMRKGLPDWRRLV